MTAFKTTSFGTAALAAVLSAATAFAAQPTQIQARGKTLASSQLATDVLNNIAAYTTKSRGCSALNAVDMEVMPPNYAPRQPMGSAPSPGGHFERWTVDGCGSSQQFEVRLTPSPQGGSDYSVMPLAGRVQIASPNRGAQVQAQGQAQGPAPTQGQPPSAPPAMPLAAWHGRYVWEEALGRIGGASPSEGAAAFVTHTLSLGPAGGKTGCTLNSEGFQTYTRMLCTAMPSGTSLVVRFSGSGPDDVRGQRAVGERLLTLTRDAGGVATQLDGLRPANDASPRTGRFFKKVG